MIKIEFCEVSFQEKLFLEMIAEENEGIKFDSAEKVPNHQLLHNVRMNFFSPQELFTAGVRLEQLRQDESIAIPEPLEKCKKCGKVTRGICSCKLLKKAEI